MRDSDGLLIADRFLAGPPSPRGGGLAERRALDKKTGRRCRVFEAPYEAGLFREAGLWSRALLKVRHPSFENLLAFEESADGNSSYWICEEAEGGTFASLAASGRPFAEAEILGLAAGLAGALRVLRAEEPDLPPLKIFPGAVSLTPGGRPVLSGLKVFLPAEEAYQAAPGAGPAAAELRSLGETLAYLVTRKTPAEFAAAGGFSGLGGLTGFSAEFCAVLEKLTAGGYASAAVLEGELALLLAGSGSPRLRRLLLAGLAAAALAAAAAAGWLALRSPAGAAKSSSGEAPAVGASTAAPAAAQEAGK